MQKQVSGYCPNVGKECSITIIYLDASDSSGKKYVKGIVVGESSANGYCQISHCPVYESAPDVLRD